MLTEKTHSAEKTLLFILAFLLAGIERFIPVFPLLPWLKIGLFHAITLVWISRFGVADALAFVFVRQWVVAAFFGFSLLPFVLGTAGSVAAVILGGLLLKTHKFGIIAVAVFSALVHNITQLFVLFLMMGGNFIWQWQMPIMAVASLFTGTITGVLAFEINKIKFQFFKIKNHEITHETQKNYLMIFALISVIISIAIFENYWFYLVLFLVICAISKPNFIVFFKRYGIFIFALYISSAFSFMQVSKVSLWFLLTPLIQASGFFTLFYGALLKIFPKKCSETLAVGAVMPQIFPQILEELPSIVKVVFKNPRKIMRLLVEKSQKILLDWEKN